METNKTDIFEGGTARKYSQSLKTTEYSDNFFMNEENIHNTNIDSTRRLNDYDSNLLQEDAYKDIDSELLRLEYKIEKTKENIKNTKAQLQAATGIGDSTLATELSIRLSALKNEYSSLIDIYNQKSLPAKITGNITKTIEDKIQTGMNVGSGILRKISSKLPKKLFALLELRKSLTQLENINKSIDDLVSMNIPYGENVDKYQQLSKYIIKANSIQSEISGLMKKG